MSTGLSARRKTVLAASALATLLMLCGTAGAADRVVLAENFTATW